MRKTNTVETKKAQAKIVKNALSLEAAGEIVIWR